MSEREEERTRQVIRQMQQSGEHAPPPKPSAPPPAPLPPPNEQPPNEQPPSGLLQFLHLDSDALLVLPLLLLLGREGADDKLLLALLYILL